jgi:prepilin-type N-terminal cleavage/methylation domain-containing protein
MPTCRAGTCKSEGFTLIELLVVLTILAISIAYVAPKLVEGETAELKGSARRFLHAIRRLSDEAVFKKEKRILTIDLDAGEYWEGDGRNKTRLPSGVFVNGVVIGTEEVHRGAVSITCFPSGLRDEASVRLARSGGTGYTVVIPALGERFEVREQ